MMSYGLILALGAAFTFTVSLALQKLIMNQNPNASPIEICFLVSIIKYIGSEVVRLYNNQPYELEKYSAKTKTLIIVNQLATVPAYILCAVSVQYISMGIAMMIGNLAPFIVAILSFVILQEFTHWTEIFNMVLCFACVIVVILQRHGEDEQTTLNLIIGVLFSFMSVLLFSITYIVCRYIRSIHYSVVTSLNLGIGAILCSIAFLFSALQRYANSNQVLTLGGLDVFYCILSGISGVGCSVMFTAASQRELASRVAQLDFTEIVFGYIIDKLVFGIELSVIEVIGCIAISLCGVAIFFISSFNDRRSECIQTSSAEDSDDFYVQIPLKQPLIQQKHKL